MKKDKTKSIGRKFFNLDKETRTERAEAIRESCNIFNVLDEEHKDSKTIDEVKEEVNKIHSLE